MTIPQLMVKQWVGDAGEYFRHTDMVRIERNLNICSQYAGIDQVEYMETTRASQFRYDEAQKVEDHIKALASAVGLSIETEDAWGYGRTVSYVDFERWEAGTWAIYQALGGVGERIPAGTVLVNYRSTLFAGSWTGTGPYEVYMEFPEVKVDTEVMVFVTHTATLEQRVAEYNAMLRAEPYEDGIIRFRALSIRPKASIPVTVAIGGLQMQNELSLPASAWSGTGPWTQTVTVPSDVREAVVGQWEGMTDTAVQQMMEGMMHVSAVKGNEVTLRIIGKKPTTDLNPMLMYDIADVTTE